MTRFPSRPLGISLAAHGLLAVALGALVGSGALGHPLPERIDVTVARVVETEPEPLLPEPEPPVVRPSREPDPVLEETPEEAVDDRVFEPPPATTPNATRGGVIGVGPGGLRVPGRRTRRPPPPAAEPEPAPPPVVPVPVGPTTRARPLPGSCTAPDYPSRERRLGVEGVVGLRVSVAADGSVLSVAVEESSGSALLDGAAAAAVRRWRFEPALREGVPVPDVVLQSIRFRLDAVASAREGR